MAAPPARQPRGPVPRACLEALPHFAGCQILLLAAAVSFGISYFEESPDGGERGIGHFIEPLVIVTILILNATVGVWMARAPRRAVPPLPIRRARSRARPRTPQESNAESALEALKEMQSEHAKCIRGGRLVSVPTPPNETSALGGQPSRPCRVHGRNGAEEMWGR